MFEWLTNYGVKQHEFEHKDLNIDDRLMLQDQINDVRKSYHDMLILLDEVQGMYDENARKMAAKIKTLNAKSIEENVRVTLIMNSDDEYLELDATQKALSAALSMINNQIDYFKSDQSDC